MPATLPYVVERSASPVALIDPATGTPLTAASLATTGQATAARQDTGNTSLSSIDTKLTTLDGRVDGLETLITSTNTKLDTIAGHVDTLEALVAATTAAVSAGTLALGRGATTAALNIVEANDRFVTITFTPSLDTGGTTAGDVLFATEELANVGLVTGANVTLVSVMISDIDDLADPMNVYFFNANTTLGTEDSAPDIDDTEVLTVVGILPVLAADFIDLGANRVAMLNNLNISMKLGASTSLWCAGTTGASTTHVAAGLQFQFTFRRD